MNQDPRIAQFNGQAPNPITALAQRVAQLERELAAIRQTDGLATRIQDGTPRGASISFDPSSKYLYVQDGASAVRVLLS